MGTAQLPRATRRRYGIGRTPTATPAPAKRNRPAVEFQGLPSGNAGARKTARIMSDLVCEYRAHPSVRDAAAEATRGIPHTETRRLAEACRTYVEQTIEYRRDPAGLELVQTPDATLRNRIGDCDDQATLLAAMLASIRLGPLGFALCRTQREPEKFGHVLCCIRDAGGTWQPLETIQPSRVGQWPGGIASYEIAPIGCTAEGSQPATLEGLAGVVSTAHSLAALASMGAGALKRTSPRRVTRCAPKPDQMDGLWDSVKDAFKDVGKVLAPAVGQVAQGIGLAAGGILGPVVGGLANNATKAALQGQSVSNAFDTGSLLGAAVGALNPSESLTKSFTETLTSTGVLSDEGGGILNTVFQLGSAVATGGVGGVVGGAAQSAATSLIGNSLGSIGSTVASAIGSVAGSAATVAKSAGESAAAGAITKQTGPSGTNGANTPPTAENPFQGTAIMWGSHPFLLNSNIGGVWDRRPILFARAGAVAPQERAVGSETAQAVQADLVRQLLEKAAAGTLQIDYLMYHPNLGAVAIVDGEMWIPTYQGWGVSNVPDAGQNFLEQLEANPTIVVDPDMRAPGIMLRAPTINPPEGTLRGTIVERNGQRWFVANARLNASNNWQPLTEPIESPVGVVSSQSDRKRTTKAATATTNQTKNTAATPPTAQPTLATVAAPLPTGDEALDLARWKNHVRGMVELAQVQEPFRGRMLAAIEAGNRNLYELELGYWNQHVQRENQAAATQLNMQAAMAQLASVPDPWRTLITTTRDGTLADPQTHTVADLQRALLDYLAAVRAGTAAPPNGLQTVALPPPLPVGAGGFAQAAPEPTPALTNFGPGVGHRPPVLNSTPQSTSRRSKTGLIVAGFGIGLITLLAFAGK